MSFLDKLSNGGAIMLIQYLHPCKADMYVQFRIAVCLNCWEQTFFFFLTHNGEEYVGKDFRWKIKGKERIDCLFSWFKSNSHLPKSCFHLQQWKPFKMMKNAFYFTLNAIFVLKMFNFLSWPFWHAGKRIVKEAKVNFKICDVTDWATNN